MLHASRWQQKNLIVRKIYEHTQPSLAMPEVMPGG